MTWKSLSPFISINSPSKIWQETPANIIFEIQLFLLFFMCTYDAFIKQKNRMYRIAWLISLFCGITIELLTVLPESIGNFYHSQFVFMLFDHREPLYLLPCVYVWFLYTLTTIIFHMNWSNKISEYAFTIIVIYFTWQPFDLIGIHFQFWTWHNDEPLYQDRHGGVPIASTFWMCSFIGGMQLSLRCIRDWYFLRNKRNWNRESIRNCIALALLASIISVLVLMMIPFFLIFHPITNKQFGLGYSCDTALNIFLYLCIGVVILQIISNLDYITIRLNTNFLYTFVFQICIGYIVCSMVMVHFIDIKSGDVFVKQVTYHQKLVMNGVQIKEPSFFGAFERNKYVVNDGIDMERDHYSLDCYDFKQEYEGNASVEWYGLCLTGLESEWISYFDKLLLISGALLFFTQFIVFTHISQSFTKTNRKND